MTGKQELARFLRGRREQLVPADVGLPGEPSRRTLGLRREEVAELAHMSVDYYARLEQARGPRPSPRILDALTGVFRLTPAERGHMFRLAGTEATPLAAPVRTVRPHVTALLRRIPDTAAIVTDALCDVIAANASASAVFGRDYGARPNLARRRFLGSTMESSGAEEFAHILVARLRRSTDRYPHDPALARLLAELRAGSEEFTQIWDTGPVHAPGHRSKTLIHPEAGPLRVNCDVLTVPDDDQQVVFVTADPGSPSERALRQLVSAGRDFSAR
ncbi:helix-turn-helix transcriptional regulator [Streptomyces sp. NPDC051576]|uniref:helix-turn-helix transcriptional regulator n=1 Tax=Streptomyces sp. NPDC051576 TaxID=3155803 RepID=UPI0034274A67